MRTPMAMALALLAAAPLHAQTDHVMPGTDPASGGKPRIFNFNGDQPFVNNYGVPNLATMQFSTDIVSTAITNEGSCGRVKGLDQNGNCLGHAVHILDPDDQLPTTRIALLATDPPFTPTSPYRTQLTSFYVDAKRTYVVDIEFKLDKDWDFEMKGGDVKHPVGSGLIWQLKSVPKPCQYGNPVMALNLTGNRLNFSVDYPKSALAKKVWPTEVCWEPTGLNGYVDGNSWDTTITKGEYHHVRFIFYADDAPNKPINDPVKPEGKGYLIALMDGQPWFQYAGPTLQPDQTKRHQMGWGWYQWSGMPAEGRSDRIIYFRQMRLRDWND